MNYWLECEAHRYKEQEMQRNVAWWQFGKHCMSMACLAGVVLGLSACMDGREISAPHATRTEHAHGQQEGTIPTDEDCASIDAWVDANMADLPTGYEDLVRFPIAYRRAIFAALPATAQSSLWRQHFQAYLTAHPDLTSAQRAFIQDTSAMVSPELFTGQGDVASSAEIDTRVSMLKHEAAALFPESELHGLLANLGPVAPVNYDAEGVACECNKKDDWCWNRLGPYTCRKGGCDRKFIGCGTLFRRKCNGLCVR